MDKGTRPDWPYWQRLGEVRLFEAVYLMLDLEPPTSPPEDDEQPKGYTKALRALSQAIGNSSRFTPCALDMGSPDLCGVRLDEVGAWALTVGYVVPAEFPRTVSADGAGIAWPLWLNLPKVELWQGVALVLGIDPEGLKRSPQSWMNGPGGGPVFLGESFPSKQKANEFQRALMFAKQATTAAGPIVVGVGWPPTHNGVANVSLREVVAFFRDGGWADIPAPLLDALDPGTKQAAAARAASETATEPQPSALPASVTVPLSNLKPVQRLQAQERTILSQIEKMGLNARALPQRASGKPGVKALIRTALHGDSLFVSDKVFDKAWERLRKTQEIADDPSPSLG